MTTTRPTNQSNGTQQASRNSSNNSQNNNNNMSHLKLNNRQIDEVAKIKHLIDDKLINQFFTQNLKFLGTISDKEEKEKELKFLILLQLQLLEHFNQFLVSTISYENELKLIEEEEAEIVRKLSEAEQECEQLEAEYESLNQVLLKKKTYDTLVDEIQTLIPISVSDNNISNLEKEIENFKELNQVKIANFGVFKDLFSTINTLINVAKNETQVMVKDPSYKVKTDAKSPITSAASFPPAQPGILRKHALDNASEDGSKGSKRAKSEIDTEEHMDASETNTPQTRAESDQVTATPGERDDTVDTTNETDIASKDAMDEDSKSGLSELTEPEGSTADKTEDRHTEGSNANMSREQSKELDVSSREATVVEEEVNEALEE